MNKLVAVTSPRPQAVKRHVAVLSLLLLGCVSTRQGEGSELSQKESDDRPRFEVHVVDVGTGLGVFVRGPDFALVYDAGSNDDTATGEKNRFTAYLRALEPARETIQHVLLSHPHRDHVELLADVINDYRVEHVWEPGVVNPICGYRRFLEAISSSPSLQYHTAAFDSGIHSVDFGREVCALPQTVRLQHAARAKESQPISLGVQATMTLLHVDGEKHTDFNQSSLVALLDLDGMKLLLMGDAGAGSREVHRAPTPRSIEGKLLLHHRSEVDADVLIVGHHGSTTSSHRAFLAAVTPKISVISSGPMKYHSVTLPEQEVIAELTAISEVFQTTVGRDDAACLVNESKIGPDNDNNPGGCDNVVVEMQAGKILAAYSRHAD